MLLSTRLPFGILCILFTHCAQVTAVCPTLPCSEDAPVYGALPQSFFSSNSNPGGGQTPVGDPPLPSTTTPAENSPTLKPFLLHGPPLAVTPSTSSPPPPVPPSTTASSTTPSSTPSLIPPSSTSTSTSPTSTPTSTTPTSTPKSTPPSIKPSERSSVEPSVVSSPSSTVAPTTTPPPNTATSSQATFPVTQSNATLSASSAKYNVSSSATVPASITQCGGCRVRADQVQVYYWPTASVRSDCARGVSVSPFETGVPYASNASKIQALAPQAADGPTTNVVDGFTFTFPSIYVSVIGGISVSDSCGLIGGVHTNPPPVAVPGITTASYGNWPSTCRPQGESAMAVIDTLDLSDIACPTWGLSGPFTTSCGGSSYLTETYGAPYNPVILVPTELMSIDPAWAVCTTDPNDPFITLPCGIYDPPIALSTASAMVPSDPSAPESQPKPKPAAALQPAASLDPGVTAVNDPPAPTTPVAAPANAGSPSLPKPTTGSSSGGSDSSDGSDPDASDPPAPSNTKSTDPGQSNSGQAASQPQAADHQASDPNSSGSDPNSSGSNPNSSGSDPNSPDSDPSSGSVDHQTSDSDNSGAKSSDDSTNNQGSTSNNSGSNSPAEPADPSSNTSGSDTSSHSSQDGSEQQEAPAPASGSQVSDPKAQAAVPLAPTTINLNSGVQPTPGVGALINGGFGGGSVPAPAPGPSPAFTPHAVAALGQTLSITDPSAVAIGGSTLSVGGPAHTSDGKYYSLAPSGNLIAGTLPAGPEPSSPPVLSVAGSTYTANSASDFVVGGQTLTPGGQINVGGTAVSLHPSANVAVVGGSTQLLATPAPSPNPAVIKIGGSTYTANAASQYVVAGQTLTPGGQITVANTPISLNPSADVAVVGGGTQFLATATPKPNPALITFAGSTYTANAASQFVVAGQTLTPGGRITVSNTPLSLAPSGNLAVIGTSTQLLTTPAPTSGPALMTFAGSTYTENSASQFIIAGQTLTPGGTITASGTPISMPQGTTNIAVIGSSTQTLASAPAVPLTAEAPVITFDGSTYTADASSDFVIASQTLTPGGIITVHGTPIRLESGAADAVVGSSTQTLASAVITPGDIVTVGGEIVTANPTGFAVDGTTVLPGGKGAVVDGTTVSLSPDGATLVVGGSSVVLPTGTGTASTSSGVAVFEGGQGKLGPPKLEWIGVYMAFWTVLGGFGFFFFFL